MQDQDEVSSSMFIRYSIFIGIGIQWIRPN